MHVPPAVRPHQPVQLRPYWGPGTGRSGRQAGQGRFQQLRLFSLCYAPGHGLELRVRCGTHCTAMHACAARTACVITQHGNGKYGDGCAADWLCCRWAGLAYVPGPPYMAWLQPGYGTGSLRTVLQEQIHNFGLYHGWSAEDVEYAVGTHHPLPAVLGQHAPPRAMPALSCTLPA